MDRHLKNLFSKTQSVLKRGTVEVLCTVFVLLMVLLAMGSCDKLRDNLSGDTLLVLTTPGKFAPIGAEWYYTYANLAYPQDQFIRIVSENDTVIKGNICRVLRYSHSHYIPDLFDVSGKHIIKEVQGKVYHYYQDKFNLFMDFGAKVNDTIEIAFVHGYSPYYWEELEFRDSIFYARYKIDSITTDNQHFRTFHTKMLDEDVFKFGFGGTMQIPPYEYQTYTYSEKIGAHREFIPMYGDIFRPPYYIPRFLRCYSDADFSYTSDEWAAMSLPCDYRYPMNPNIKFHETGK